MNKQPRDITDILRKSSGATVQPVQIGEKVLHFKSRANLELSMLGFETMGKGMLIDENLWEEGSNVINDYMLKEGETGNKLRKMLLNSIIKSDDNDVFDKLAIELDIEVEELTYFIIKEVLTDVMNVVNL